MIHNKWGFSFLHTAYIITLALVVHDGKLLWLCWDGHTSIWRIKHVPNFQYEHPLYRFSHTKFEYGFRLSWKYMDHLTNDINEKCQGYIPFHSMNGFILMYKDTQVSYRVYAFKMGFHILVVVDIVLITVINGFPIPTT